MVRVTDLVAGLLAGSAVLVVGARGGRSVGRLVRTPREVGGRLRRRAPTPGADLAVVLAQVAAVVRAGAAPGSAWSQVAGVRTGLDGAPLTADLVAVIESVDRTALRQVSTVVAATRLAHELGMPLAAVLDRTAATVGAAQESAAERASALAGPRATARVLGWLPVLGLAVGTALGADPVALALDGGAGTASVLLGLVLLVVGRWWTARLVRTAERAGEPA